MGISTHVLDTARGRPASGVPVTLERSAGTAWEHVASGATDADGRARDLCPGSVAPGRWRLRFDVASWAAAQGTPAFFPVVEITFAVESGAEHHHVPLLLSPFGYSTYRGS
jgi:5-hydroxyisourate hydrolase